MHQKIARSPKAIRDLELHVDYIVKDSEAAAHRFLDAAEKTFLF